MQFKTSNHQKPTYIYTLTVDGKKLAVGTTACFKSMRGYSGIEITLSIQDDLLSLPIHPKTPPKIQDHIRAEADFIKQRRYEAEQFNKLFGRKSTPGSWGRLR